ncbi:MAG: sulfotransferase [Planctomycetes bacterium]|nr:sulfotransferase [Planctomycetota bacterium]
MIVVTGMHRSGTSLLCQLLATLGVPFGGPEGRFATDRWNADGYFELVAVMDANSRLVTGLPRNRSRLLATLSKLVYLTMPGQRRIAARARRLAGELQALAPTLRHLAVKDPRFCLTFRHWDVVVPVAKVLVCVRDPAAVAASLRRRNRLPLALGHRFYRYHVESLLAQVPPERTMYVDMDALALRREVHGLDQVRQFLGLGAGPASAAVLRAALRDGAYRSSPSLPRACPPAVVALHERLLALADAGPPRGAAAP